MDIRGIDLTSIPGNIAHNVAAIGAAITANADADVLVFPELCVTGYAIGDDFFRPALQKEVLDANETIAAMSKDGPVLIWGNIHHEDGRQYNGAFVAEDGIQTAVTKKTLLPDYLGFSEPRYFSANKNPCAPVLIKGNRIGITICEDLWDEDYDRSPIEELAAAGIDHVVQLAATPFRPGKWAHRQQCYDHAQARAGVSMTVAQATGVLNNGKNLYALVGQTKDVSSHIDQQHAALLQILKDFEITLPAGPVWLGVSGGIDSAVCVCVLAEAFGPDRIKAVNMPSSISSEEHQTAALQLCSALGVEMTTRPIDHYLSCFAPANGVPAENLQARTRGAVLAHQAALSGGVYISCGNKTELALGYGTLYGDMSGAIAPLGDLVKGEVYALAERYDAIPSFTKTTAPSAELQPGQRDPFWYPYHDQLVRAFVERRQSPIDILRQYNTGSLVNDWNLPTDTFRAYFPTATDFIEDLELQWGRYRGTAFKRVQTPPVPVLSACALGSDLREYLGPVQFTVAYIKLKQDMLSAC